MSASTATSPFGHGQFKLYLLALLRERPRHGYELIKTIEETFGGAYAPSAGSVYPRLSKLEAEGLVAREVGAGGRKVYRITADGEAELDRRESELQQLNQHIDRSVAEVTRHIGEDVRAEAASIRAELGRARPVQSGPARRSWFRRSPEAVAELPAAAATPADEAPDIAPRGGVRPEQWGAREWREALSWGAEWRHEWSDYWAMGKGSRQVERMIDRFREDAHHALEEGGAVDAAVVEECRQALGEALVRIRRATGN